MFLIPGFIISLLTFPGIIVHEFAHQLFCRLFHVPVFKVCYFRLGNPAGYVLHEKPKEDWQQVLIGIGPFFVNTILGLLIAFPAAAAFNFHDDSPLNAILIYLGASIAMHSFPSRGDAESIWKNLEGKTFKKILVSPLMLLIYIGAFGSIVWLDLIYGVAVTVWLPNLLIKSMA